MKSHTRDIAVMAATDYRLLLLFLVSRWLIVSSRADLETAELSNKQLEDTVFIDMLKLVDSKFDTLTTRITAMETAVSSLQFYTQRHFRHVLGGIQSMGNDLETVRKQVSQTQEEMQEHKGLLTLLAGDVSELKKSSSDLLGELESSVFYINENLDKNNQESKSVVRQAVLAGQREAGTLVGGKVDQLSLKLDMFLSKPIRCNVDFSNISEHIDLKFADFKLQTQTHVLKLIHAAKMDSRRNSPAVPNYPGESSRKDACDCPRSLDSSSTPPHQTTASLQQKTISEDIQDRKKVNVSEDIQDRQKGGADSNSEVSSQDLDEKDKQVMDALYNMTGSVLQAVHFLRHTGSVLEQILANSDTLTSQQLDLAQRLDTLQAGLGTHNTDQQDPYRSNLIPVLDNLRGQTPYYPGIKDKPCDNSDLIKNIAAIVRNGSQLLEVLTDLAQLSSQSLSKSTASLQEEVAHMEGIRSLMATTLLAAARDSNHFDSLPMLTNKTHKIYRLVETIASNTGWLPQIMTSVQHQESMSNRSLQAVLQNQATMRRLQQDCARDDPLATLDYTEQHPRQRPKIIGSQQGPGQRASIWYHDDENKELMETIYSTNLQLTRIMPALTKLLSEPDPLISLVGGGRPDQGRLEIYHNGLWGAFCSRDLSHPEADLICRHLGFQGGISAGAGHFGPGAGVPWSLNVACVGSSACPVVNYSENTTHCSHDLDVGVICDHMLRIVSSNGSTGGHAGRLEIHHRGLWLPICSEGWSGYSARVACQQMGFLDGREMEVSQWSASSNTTWLTQVACTGREARLDVCSTSGWSKSCSLATPAGVRCV